MLPELLVILACSQNQGCKPTTDLYFNTHPDAKAIVRTGKTNLKKLVGPQIILMSPILFVAAGGSDVVHLNKHLSLELSRNENLVLFTFEF